METLQVLLQGTCTPLVHAHVGRTQAVEADLAMSRFLRRRSANRLTQKPRHVRQTTQLGVRLTPAAGDEKQGKR